MTSKEKDTVIRQQAEKVAELEQTVANLRQEVYEGQIQELQLRRKYMALVERIASQRAGASLEVGERPA